MQFLFVLVTLTSLVVKTTGQTTGQCQTRFRVSATQCFTNVTLNIQNVQWLTSNSTSGTVPQEPVQTYRKRVCDVQVVLEQCGQRATQEALNDTRCINPVDRQSVANTFQSTFVNLNPQCAQPCRMSLMTDLLQCISGSLPQDIIYRPPVSILSELDLLKTALIGEDGHVAWNICHERQQITRCMQEKINLCPGAERELNIRDFDFNAFETGFNFLCQNQGVYNADMRCFRDIQQVRNCYTTYDQELQQLRNIGIIYLRADRISSAKFCEARMKAIRCETMAWSSNQYRDCIRPVSGLRNELGCQLVSQTCTSADPNGYRMSCDRNNFFLEERKGYNSAHAHQANLVIVMVTFLVTLGWRLGSGL